MDLIWIELQEMAVLVLFWPLVTLAAFVSGGAILVVLAELLMELARVFLARMGLLE